MTELGRPQHCAILVRHAKREGRWDKSEDRHQMAGWRWGQRPLAESNFNEKDGLALTYSLAGRLCDQLLADNIAVKKIVHSEHLVAKQTASVYKDVLEERQINMKVLGERDAFRVERHQSRALTPGNYSEEALEQSEWAIDQVKIALKSHVVVNRKGPASLAYILVGHQPELTLIARRWLGRSLPFETLPIEASEAACLGVGDEPRLLWLITNKQDALMADLKDKIKSKYDVAKFFLGAFVVNTGLILNAGVWGNIGPSNTSTWIDKALVTLAIIAAVVSLVFTAATLFSYDALLMPSTFWSERSDPTRLPRGLRKPPRWSINRPPSQAHVVLFYEMVHIWKAFFTPAIVTAFIAVGLLIVALARRGVGAIFTDVLEPLGWWTILLTFSLVTLAFFLPLVFYRRRKPRLGSED
jgi:hypothetical protein